MPRFRVGERVFESQAEADAHRASTPDAPATFVEPDAGPAVDAYAELQKESPTRWPNLPWILPSALLAAELGVRVLAVQVFLHGHAPRVGPAEVAGYLVHFAMVWRAAAVLSNPSRYSRFVVTSAAMFSFFAILSLAGWVVFGVSLVRRYAHRREATAAVEASPLAADGPSAPLPGLPPYDAGPPAPTRPWAAYESAEDGYTASFPGAPITHDHDARVECADHAVFEILHKPQRGHPATSMRRATADELAGVETRTRGVLLGEEERYADATRRAERAARVGLSGPPRMLYVRVVATRAGTWVVTAELPAGQPEGDAQAFLESFALTR